jgi:tetratricopeptide (TPR) repeat protein
MANGKFVGVLPGRGSHSYKIATNSDSAQFYFDQGLTMYYSFHMKEAMASFQEAARQDSTCAMAWWGQALTGGPYFNAAYTYKMPPTMPAILARMNELASYASPKEKKMIQVMNTRYSSDLTDSERGKLNQAYASATRQLLGEFNDPDTKMLYVDAIMLIHAWNFWNPDGSPQAWTPEIVALCEAVLKTNPEHPAALHYHIHLTEASRHPEVALPNAAKLRSVLPGVAHMVHMASHEYQRSGLFEQGVIVNDDADNDLSVYASLAPNLGLIKQVPHYLAVKAYCALSGGMYEVGMRHSMRSRQSVAPTADNTGNQYVYMLPTITLVRLGKWQEILATQKPDASWPYATLLDQFARGMALVNTGKTAAAREQLQLLRRELTNPVLAKRTIPFNAPLSTSRIAGYVLEASIQFVDKNYVPAVAALDEAIKLEDQLIYTEPSDWPLPARQFLGAYLLKMGNVKQAETVYRDDLARHPGNGWSLVGLHQALRRQGKRAELGQIEKKYRLAFSKAESIPTSSVY